HRGDHALRAVIDRVRVGGHGGLRRGEVAAAQRLVIGTGGRAAALRERPGLAVILGERSGAAGPVELRLEDGAGGAVGPGGRRGVGGRVRAARVRVAVACAAVGTGTDAAVSRTCQTPSRGSPMTMSEAPRPVTRPSGEPGPYLAPFGPKTNTSMSVGWLLVH